MSFVTKRNYQFDAKLAIPTAAGTPAAPTDRMLWVDTNAGKLAVRIAGSTVLVPLASEIGGAGLTQEQITDFMSLVIVDNAVLDWTYDDAANAGAGTLVATIKPGVISNTELSNMAQSTMKGRAAGAGTGATQDLNPAQIKTILALVAADISDFQTAARAAITVTDTSSLNLTYAAGDISGAVLDSPLLGGQTKAQIQTDIINAISGGAGAAYDTLVEIQALLEADDSADAIISAGLAVRARFYAATLANGAPTATVTHGMALTNIHDFTYRIFVSATGAEEEYEAVGATANTITVTDETGGNIPAGRRIFVTAGV
jgi:hypothetical protein